MSELQYGDQLQALLLEYNRSNKGFDQGRKLVEYLALNRQNQHSELILDFGIHIA